MFDVHLSLELLEAVADGSLSRETFERLALEHTLVTSPRVAALAAELATPAATAPPPAPEDYELAFDRVQASTGAWLAVKGADERGAALDLAELLNLPSSAWAERVQRSRRRFSSPTVAERLLAIAKAALAEGRPQEVFDAARAAFWVARRLGAGHGAYDALQHEFGLRASAYEAMASRALGDLAAARRLLDTVRQARARGELGGDPLADAEVAYFEALVDRDDERFADAEAAFLVALTTTNALGAEAEEAEARVAFARSLARSDELEEAVDTLRPIGTEELLDAPLETLLAARLELAELLARLGHPRQASAALTASREIAAALGGTALGRLALTRGLLSVRRGWRPEGVRELARAHDLLLAEAPLLAARAAAAIAEAAVTAGRLEDSRTAWERLRAVVGLPEAVATALAECAGANPPPDDLATVLADLSAYFAAAHESPGLIFHRAYPGAQRLA